MPSTELRDAKVEGDGTQHVGVSRIHVAVPNKKIDHLLSREPGGFIEIGIQQTGIRSAVFTMRIMSLGLHWRERARTAARISSR